MSRKYLKKQLLHFGTWFLELFSLCNASFMFVCRRAPQATPLCVKYMIYLNIFKNVFKMFQRAPRPPPLCSISISIWKLYNMYWTKYFKTIEMFQRPHGRLPCQDGLREEEEGAMGKKGSSGEIFYKKFVPVAFIKIFFLAPVPFLSIFWIRWEKIWLFNDSFISFFYSIYFWKIYIWGRRAEVSVW